MIIQFTFLAGINVSLQVGDLAYYSMVVNNQSGSNHLMANTNTKPTILGPVVAIDRVNLTVDVEVTTTPPWYGTGDDYFIFFQKIQNANTSGMIGYFAEAQIRNYTREAAEMFTIAVDYIESSK